MLSEEQRSVILGYKHALTLMQIRIHEISQLIGPWDETSPITYNLAHAYGRIDLAISEIEIVGRRKETTPPKI